MIEEYPNYFQELMAEGVPETLPKSDFCFEDLFDEFVAGTQKTWKHDRALSIGASEAFGCSRKSWFGKVGKEKGIEKDPDYVESWGAVRRGDLIENYHVVPAIENGLRRRGMDLIMAGDGQDTILDGVSSATLDGLVINAPRDLLSAYGIDDMGTDCCVLEMKSFDPRINIIEEKGIHRGQTQMQMGLIRETTEYKPEFAVILYVNASWLDDIRIFVVEYDHDVYLSGRARAEKIYAAEKASELMAEGKLDGSCDYCPFKRACNEASVSRVPASRKALTKKEVEAQDQTLVSALEPLTKHELRLKAQKKVLEKEIAEVQEDIRQELIRANESRAVGDTWKVSYTTVAGRRTLSKDKLIEAGLDPEDFMEQGGGYEKLTVTGSFDGN